MWAIYFPKNNEARRLKLGTGGLQDAQIFFRPHWNITGTSLKHDRHTTGTSLPRWRNNDRNIGTLIETVSEHHRNIHLPNPSYHKLKNYEFEPFSLERELRRWQRNDSKTISIADRSFEMGSKLIDLGWMPERVEYDWTSWVAAMWRHRR